MGGCIVGGKIDSWWLLQDIINADIAIALAYIVAAVAVIVILITVCTAKQVNRAAAIVKCVPAGFARR